MRLARYVKFRDEKFGGVLFETRSEKVYTLSPTAAAVVHQVAAGQPPADIAPVLATQYDAPEAAIERDVAAFLAELRDKGLVEE
jgi:hypothetical protein